MNIEEQRRKAFEARMGPILRKERIGDPDKAFDKDPDGRYYRNYVYSAWLAWNAALDSLVIELPGSFMPGEAQHPCIEVPDIIEAIEAAGLKVKP